jgi:hypothetical protein
MATALLSVLLLLIPATTSSTGAGVSQPTPACECCVEPLCI